MPCIRQQASKHSPPAHHRVDTTGQRRIRQALLFDVPDLAQSLHEEAARDEVSSALGANLCHSRSSLLASGPWLTEPDFDRFVCKDMTVRADNANGLEFRTEILEPWCCVCAQMLHRTNSSQTRKSNHVWRVFPMASLDGSFHTEMMSRLYRGAGLSGYTTKSCKR